MLTNTNKHRIRTDYKLRFNCCSNDRLVNKSLGYLCYTSVLWVTSEMSLSGICYLLYSQKQSFSYNLYVCLTQCHLLFKHVFSHFREQIFFTLITRLTNLTALAPSIRPTANSLREIPHSERLKSKLWKRWQGECVLIFVSGADWIFCWRLLMQTSSLSLCRAPIEEQLHLEVWH